MSSNFALSSLISKNLKLLPKFLPAKESTIKPDAISKVIALITNQKNISKASLEKYFTFEL